MSTTSIKKAAIINFAGKYTNIFIQLIYNAILARILTPEDFGIVAVVTVFTNFFMLFANMGIGPAIIHDKEFDENDNNNIFTFTIYIGLIIAVLFSIFSAIFIASFYDNDIYIPIGILLSVSLFFNTLNIVPNALLLKEHRFKLVSMRMVIVAIVTAIPTIFLAFMGLKYYAIVFHSILVSMVTFLWNYRTVRPKFQRKITLDSYRRIRSYSSYQMGFSFINYFSRNIDNLLIGRFIDSKALGFYDKSYKLMLYPVNNLTHVITPVLHPILSKEQDNKRYVYHQYVKVVKILSLLGIFITAYSYFAGEEIIRFFYGNQWDASIPSFKILSLSIFFQMTVSSAGAIYQTLGNTRNMFKSSIIFTSITITCIVIGVALGDINSVALFVLISLIIKFFIDYYFLINKSFGLSVISFYKIFIPDLIIFAFMFMGMSLASLITIENTLLSLIYKMVVCVVIYIAGIYLTKQDGYIKMLIQPKKTK